MKNRILTSLGLLLALPICFIIYSFFPDQATAQLKTPTSAPNLLVMDGQGDTFNVTKFKGKVVVLNFWASWSKASRLENKNLVRIYQKYKNNNKVVFYSVSLDTDEQSWNAEKANKARARVQTAAKNVAPYIAWPKPAMIHIYRGSETVVTSGLRARVVMAKRAMAPTINRIAATPREVALSGPSARDVPVVAKQIAANSTNSRERTAKR